MNKKIVLLILICVLLLLATFWMKFNLPVAANPVYPGEVLMTREDVDVTISYAGSVVQARVNGTYTFVFAGTPPTQVTMYYPVPPDASNISVVYYDYYGNYTPDWGWNETYYHTVIGDYPFINWTIFWMPPVPANFTIRTHYEHSVPLIEGKYKFLYAFGTGKLVAPKYCPANITVYISKDVALTEDDIDVYLVTDEGISEPATYVITPLDEVWNVTYHEGNTMGTKDFLVTIIPEFPTRISMLLILVVLTVAITITKRRLLKTPIH